MPNLSCSRVLVAVSAVSAAAVSMFVALSLRGGRGRRVGTDYERCVLLPDVSPGSEDIVVVDAKLALVSSGDVDRIFFQRKGPNRRGEIHAIVRDDDKSLGGAGKRTFSSPPPPSPSLRSFRVPILNMPTSDTPLSSESSKSSESPTSSSPPPPVDAREAFHPHGISYSNRTGLLYAVSHDCGVGRVPSETIEVFELVVRRIRSEGDGSGGATEGYEPYVPGSGFSTDTSGTDHGLALMHVRTILSPEHFHLGGLNDLVEGSFMGEIYATQWISSPVHNHCHGHGAVMHELRMVATALFERTTRVLRCVWDPNDRDNDVIAVTTTTAKCRTAADGFRVTNGITSDPDHSQYYVLDSVDHTLSIFDRSTNADNQDEDNNDDGSLTLVTTLDMRPYGLDNVEYDVPSRRLTLSVSTGIIKVLGRMFLGPSVKVDGGMATVVLPPPTGDDKKNNADDDNNDNKNDDASFSYTMEEVLMHDGSKLSMLSSAVFFGDMILLGSPVSDGVLACETPSTPLPSSIIRKSIK